MLQEVVKYQTPDGKEFASKEEATMHLNAEKYLARIGRFLGSKEWKRGRDTLALNNIKAFLAFEELHPA